MEFPIDIYLRKAMLDHMMSDEPREVCGLVTLANEYIPCKNYATHPEMDFLMSPDDSFRLMHDPVIVAHFHSHPGGFMSASKHDMETQARIGKPFIIAARHAVSKHVEIFQLGDHLLDMPLEGLPFRYNTYDCWELLRRYFWQKHEIKLKTNPRDPYFWASGDDLIGQGFKEWGFTEFDPKTTSPEVGDVQVYQTDGVKVMNHCAVYVGNNCILHHRANRKSGVSPITFYQSAGYLRKWLRYTGNNNA